MDDFDDDKYFAFKAEVMAKLNLIRQEGDNSAEFEAAFWNALDDFSD